MLNNVNLGGKYTLEAGRVFISGAQALVRMPMMQRKYDLALGVKSAGFVTGYCGPLLESYDAALWKARKELEKNHIRFQSGIDESHAANAVRGTQYLESGLFRKAEGIFSIWYGQGQDIDRSGDVFKQAGIAGSSPKGGVLVVFGDDCSDESSAVCLHGEPTLVASNIPILYPANVDELLEYGLYGWALSRYSGCWVGMKCVDETLECSTTVNLTDIPPPFVEPQGSLIPEENIHSIDQFDLKNEAHILLQYRLSLVHAFVRNNRLDSIVFNSSIRLLGIICAGKSYLDVMQALDFLGIDQFKAKKLGLCIYKVGMIWPLEPEGLLYFSGGLKELLFVEENSGFIEDQAKQLLSSQFVNHRPFVIGKTDEKGRPLFSTSVRLSPLNVALVIGKRLQFLGVDDTDLALQVRELETRTFEPFISVSAKFLRAPYRCANHSYSVSFNIPERCEALSTVGFRILATWMNWNIHRPIAMVGEEFNWVIMAPFSDHSHVFQNLGDGIYTHSDFLVVRAVSSGVKITYKILFNKRVLTAGGRPLGGQLSVTTMTYHLHEDGVSNIAIGGGKCVGNHYAEDRVNIDGVNINSNNMWSRNVRKIDRPICNKNVIYFDKFYPTSIAVIGGKLKKIPVTVLDNHLFEDLIDPVLPAISRGYNILIAGVGGTGVLTVGGILAIAAHLEGKGSNVYNMTRGAQNGGAVLSHLRISGKSDDIYSASIGCGEVDLLLGCDLVVSGHIDTMKTISKGRSRAVINSHAVPVSSSQLQQDLDREKKRFMSVIGGAVGRDNSAFIDASSAVSQSMGHKVAINMFMVGYAYQNACLPVSSEAIRQAIILNDVQVNSYLNAFDLGRLACTDKQPLAALMPSSWGSRYVDDNDEGIEEDFSSFVEVRYQYLTSYQSRYYADQYRSFIDEVVCAENDMEVSEKKLARAVADNLFKLMAYKDEYEVARLYASGKFMKKFFFHNEGGVRFIDNMFPSFFNVFKKIKFRRLDSLSYFNGQVSSRPRKDDLNLWMTVVMYGLAKFKFLRGTLFDPLGCTKERREERLLIKEYRAVIRHLLISLTPYKYALAVQIAELPKKIRGYGHKKIDSILAVKERQRKLLIAYHRKGGSGYQTEAEILHWGVTSGKVSLAETHRVYKKA